MIMSITPEDVFEYHSRGRPGKIEVRATKPLLTQRDLSLAYSPGVAEVVTAVKAEPLKAFDYTARGNLVGVVSNGTAILGLGNLGALAAKPVMEGKGVLFKSFADIDVFDIELDTMDPEVIIATVRAMAPTFGGINLEDIKAPECFYIERRLRELCDIPVFHDDQHGTAIITGAALINALKVTGKKIENLRIVFAGAGAAAISTANFCVSLGVPREQITMCDEHGVVYTGRTIAMDEYKGAFAVDTEKRTLAEAFVDADVFVGLSVANIVTAAMVKSMAPSPIIFALANPNPEIPYEMARQARPDALIGTGRSDLPNQINNVLGFPFIFRGALDVRARTINEPMKIAASHALAELAHEDVPDSVLDAYRLKALKFGPDYLIPKPLDPRVLLYVAPAVAKAAIDSGVSRISIDIDSYRDHLEMRRGKGEQVRVAIINKAKNGARQRLVYGEGEESKVIRAAAQVADERIADPVLIGRPEVIRQVADELGLTHFNPTVINPDDCARMPVYVDAFYARRQRHGVSRRGAEELLRKPNYLGPILVATGDADAYLSGLTYEYPEVIRPALQVFHTRPGVRLASGIYLLIANNEVYVFTDATVNIDPTADDLAEIAILAADFARTLDIHPRIAMLSFSNFGSTRHPLSDKVRRATAAIKAKRPDLVVDGEMQADVALNGLATRERYPFSAVSDANVLVFPSLEAANIAYKLLAKLGNAQIIGPILLGLSAPVHVLQTGDSVQSIVAMSAVAAMDAQVRQRGEEIPEED
jgi:malate dehydrogenase (oxaloacetate-decarboxylating)(NADP+)